MKPSIVLSNPREHCVTLTWAEQPEIYIGYRFLEGEPVVAEEPISGYEGHPKTIAAFPTVKMSAPPDNRHPNPKWKSNWKNAYSEEKSSQERQLSFSVFNEGTARIFYTEKKNQYSVEWYFHPFENGVHIQARLTSLVEIKGAFCLSQCLRFTGNFNDQWRQDIAHAPFLSELDMQAMGNANGTLTWARRNNTWFRFPVQHCIYLTCNEGIKMFDAEKGLVDHGLIARETPSRQEAPAYYWDAVAPNTKWEHISCGMFWERTVCISNRHPADCVHAWIDFGPLAAGQSRTLTGVVYYIEGTKEDILALWKKDFGSSI
jgi:hypothetical protein